MKNKVISLFLAATMVLSLCPATVRAQTVSEEFSTKVADEMRIRMLSFTC